MMLSNLRLGGLLLPVVLLPLFLTPDQAALAQDEGQRVYKQTLKSTVWIVAAEVVMPDGRRGLSTGSGALIDPVRRLVLTNCHVVDENQFVIVQFPVFEKGALVSEKDRYMDMLRTRGIRGRVIAKEPRADIALVQLESVPKDAPGLKLARESAGPGQRVHSIGNPGASGALWVYTSGTVRQVYQKRWRAGEEGTEYYAKVVETQSPTNAGDSGGPLVNDNGELVGVTQGGSSKAQLVSLFIDLSEVRGLLNKARIPVAVAGSGGGRNRAEEEEDDGRTLGDKPSKSAPKGDVKPETKPKPPVTDAGEKAAASRLSQAMRYMEDGLYPDARQICEEIVAKYPTSKAAAEAKQLLETKLKKK